MQTKPNIQNIRIKAEGGSLAPLGIGLFVITLGLVLAIVSASSLFIFQKRLTNISESAALFAVATGEPVQNFLDLTDSAAFKSLRMNAGYASDSATLRVQSCALWSAPIILLGQLNAIEVCSHAAARAE